MYAGVIVPRRRDYARYCIQTLQKTHSVPERTQAPSADHVAAFQVPTITPLAYEPSL